MSPCLHTYATVSKYITPLSSVDVASLGLNSNPMTHSFIHSTSPHFSCLPSFHFVPLSLSFSLSPSALSPATIRSRTGVMSLSVAVSWEDVDRVIGSASDPSAYSLGCTSSAITMGSWYERGMLHPHEPTRYLVLMLERAVQPKYFQPHRSWKVRRLFHFYRTIFYPFVHEHHDAEEHIYFPWLTSKPGIKLPDRLSADHVTLIAGLDAIAAFEHSYPGEQQHDKLLESWAISLRSQVSAVAGLLRDHLQEEEQSVPNVLRDHFTPQEEVPVIGRIAAHLPPDIAPMFIAMVISGQLRAGGQQALADFIALLPPGVGDVYLAVWKRQLEADMAYLDSVTLDSDVEPECNLELLMSTQAAAPAPKWEQAEQ